MSKDGLAVASEETTSAPKMSIQEAEKYVQEGKGIYGNTYYKALCILQAEHKHDKCPIELSKRKTIMFGGFKCEIYYNFVPPYCLGRIPQNRWMCFADGDYNEEWFVWDAILKDDVKTLEDATNFIRPLFRMAVKRLKKKSN